MLAAQLAQLMPVIALVLSLSQSPRLLLLMLIIGTGCFSLFVCHLAGVSHSGGYSHFRQNNGLQQDVDSNNSKKNQNLFHDCPFRIG